METILSYSYIWKFFKLLITCWNYAEIGEMSVIGNSANNTYEVLEGVIATDQYIPQNSGFK